MADEKSFFTINAALTMPGHEAINLAPHELSERDSRIELLRGHFLDIADTSTPHTDQTIIYIRGGGSLRLCLNELMTLSDPCDQDQAVRDARGTYMDVVFERPGILHRKACKQRLRASEETYIDTIRDKIEAIVDAQTPEDALRLGQMPTLVEKASFAEDIDLTEEDLAANHLYILVDTALKEHVHRRHAIDRHRSRSLTSRVAGSRAVQMSVAGGVFAATLSPRIGVLSAHSEYLAQNMEAGLKVLSGAVLGLSAPEAARLKYLDIVHGRRTSQLQDRLAASQHLSDLALRTTYNSTRYGSPDGSGRVTGRSGTADKEENLHRFARMDKDFPHLNNDPGGKPYTGEQALGYAARLLIERKDHLAKILDKNKTPGQKKDAFLELCEDILTEDVIRMKKGLKVSRVRRRVVNAIALVPATFFPSAASTANEASSLSRDTTGALSNSRHSE